MTDSNTSRDAPSKVSPNESLDMSSDGDHNHGHNHDGPFTVNIKLPHEPWSTSLHVTPQEQVQDIRQSLMDQPFAMQHSCFHLEHDGKSMNDFVELSEIPGVGPDSTLTLVEDPYTEKEARVHLLRMRELVGAVGDKTDLAFGVGAGISLHDTISQRELGEGADGSARADFGNYNYEDSPSLDTMSPRSRSQPPKTLKSMSLSPWNPPPYVFRMKGHLLYLAVTTNEGDQFHITSHVSGFYINRSTHNKFDPLPKAGPKSYKAHSLLTLLHNISPAFKAAHKLLIEHNGRRDPLSLFQVTHTLPASPWLVQAHDIAITDHQPDIARTQESFLYSGTEKEDNLRDWNEEFQSTREMPRESVSERVLRDRLTVKLFADYAETAVRGAILIARGELTPLNPTENRDAHIFVHNNVFFSFGADGVGTFVTEGGDEAARVATGKDVRGVKLVNQMDISGLFTAGTVVVDYLGKRIVGQSIVPGIFKQREPGENQIDYGGVDGKDVIAADPAFVPVFEQMSQKLHVKKHPVWDKEGRRHDLEASVETKGLLGTDGRKYVLDLYRVSPLDISWIEKYWGESEEEKTGAEKKDYPHRMTTLRPELVESYHATKLKEYADMEVKKLAESKLLPNGHAESKDSKNADNSAAGNKEVDEAEKQPEQTDEKTDATESSEGTEIVKANGSVSKAIADESNAEQLDLSGFDCSLNPDTFSGQTPPTEDEAEKLQKDEAEVRACCDYLHNNVIPKLISDLQEAETGFPMDGVSLTALLHKRGINVRYLGKIAELADQTHPRLQALRRLALQEMVSRAFKHTAIKYLRDLPVTLAPACVSHMLNCFLGTKVNDKPVCETDESMKLLYDMEAPAYESLTPQRVMEELSSQIRRRFRYNIGENLLLEGKELQMLREICLKLGVQLVSKDYRFTKPEAAANGHAIAPAAPTSTSSKKKKKGTNGSPNRSDSHAARSGTLTFHPDDIVNFIPLVKEAAPKSTLTEEAFAGGRLALSNNDVALAQDLFMESLSLYEQIYGILHPEVAHIYQTLPSLYFSLDNNASDPNNPNSQQKHMIGVDLAHKAVIIAERTLGSDSTDTILAYLNLSVWEHANGNPALGLIYVLHAMDLTRLIFGADHPDEITTINNAAVLLQSLKRYGDSRAWFEKCLALAEKHYGSDSVNAATILFQLAQALALDRQPRDAVRRMRESYALFRARLGDDHRNSREAEYWLGQLTENAVSVAKRAREDAAEGVRRLVRFAGLSSGALNLPGPGRGAADRTGMEGEQKGEGTPKALMDNRNIDDLIKYIEGEDKKAAGKKRGANPKRRGGKV